MMDVQQKDKLLIVTLLEKRLDTALAQQFEDKIRELIDAGHQQIVLNLSQVDFIDSSGLGAVVASLKSLSSKAGHKGKLVLCGARGEVDSLFKLTRMDKVFTMYTNLDDVLKVANS